jgi:hypothetical protein
VAYKRGKADKAEEIRRFLASTPVDNRPRTQSQPIPTPQPRSTPTPQQRSTQEPEPRAVPVTVVQITDPAIRWVRPAPGLPLHPYRPAADPHPPTTEWTGMPSRVAYQDRLPSPPPAPPKTKPGFLEPWPAPSPMPREPAPAQSNKVIRKRKRDAERRAEYRRRKLMVARKRSQSERAGPSQQYRLQKPACGSDRHSTSEGPLVCERAEPATPGSETPARADQPEFASNSAGPQESMEVDDRVLEDPDPSLPIEEDFPSFYTCSPPTSTRED